MESTGRLIAVAAFAVAVWLALVPVGAPSADGSIDFCGVPLLGAGTDQGWATPCTRASQLRLQQAFVTALGGGVVLAALAYERRSREAQDRKVAQHKARWDAAAERRRRAEEQRRASSHESRLQPEERHSTP